MVPPTWALNAGAWLSGRAVVLGLIGASLAASWVGGCQYKAKQIPALLAAERAALVESERRCEVGTVCEGALVTRAAAQDRAVAAARARADQEHAAALAALEASHAADLAAALEARESDARTAAALERRYRAALSESEDCRIWSAKIVPCPLD